MRFRLLVVAASLGGGGAERVMITLLRHLDRERFEIHLALVDASGPYLSQVPADVCVHDLRARRARYAFFRIVGTVRRVRPSVVFTTLGYLNLAVLAGRGLWPRGSRLWIREANIPSASISSTPRRRLFRWLYRRLYRRADGIICGTEEIRRELTENFGVPGAKLEVIVNPVDEGAVRLRADQDGGLGPAAGGFSQIVAAGRLTRQKGFDLLIRAVAPILRRRPEVRLTILGRGPEESALRSLAESLGVWDSVSLPGFVENPYRFFKAAGLFVLSSRWEGLPNVVLEALACGTPVVAFDCAGGAMRELAQISSEVELVPPGDVDALEKAIENKLKGEKAGVGSSLLPSRFRLDAALRRFEGVFLGIGNPA